MGPALLVLLVVAFRRRWFCRYACPTGFLLAVAGRNSTRAARRRGERFPQMARPLAWACIGTALAGYPVLLWMDPLSLFCGVSGWPRAASGPALLAVVVPLLLLILGTFLWPGVWCGRICPLGGLQDVVFDAARVLRGNRAATVAAEDPARRGFLVLLAAMPAGWALRSLHLRPRVIRPPGAAAPDVFSGLCSRCGLCTSVCPQHIVAPDLGRTGLAGLLTPVLTFQQGYCDEWCNRCTQVCPTGALRPLSVAEKRADSLGTAVIDRSTCLAWANRKSCVVCQEFCPYHAVTLAEHQGVPCPSVDAARCRGCGACEKECPVRPVRAIQVQPSNAA